MFLINKTRISTSESVSITLRKQLYVVPDGDSAQISRAPCDFYLIRFTCCWLDELLKLNQTDQRVQSLSDNDNAGGRFHNKSLRDTFPSKL